MKKIFLTTLLIIVFLTGCGTDNTVAEPEVQETVAVLEVDPEKAEIDDFFKKYVNTNERPIAVMIDNDDHNARPQAGLDDAYLIYEMVVEGGSTRFMPLFRSADTNKIGPVRSSRHYFLDYVMENDAVYTHFGWSPKAMSDISTYKINKINGVLGEDGYIFWKEEKFKGDWHSAYTNIKNIKDIAAVKGYNLQTEHKNGINYSDEYFDLNEANSATDVSLAYSGGYKTDYKYNKDKKVYEKYINNNPHTMQNGNVLEFKNIIIISVYDTSLGDGTARRNINTVGSGKGYYITNGCFEKITWQKNSRNGNTVFKKENGDELYINPGKTIINLFSPSYKITIK